MNKGFTLIELLVVVLIIGILAAIALPQYTKAVERSRMSEAVQIMGDLATAESIYYMQQNEFSNASATSAMPGDLTLTLPGSTANWEVAAAVTSSASDKAPVTLTATRHGGIYSGSTLQIVLQNTGAMAKTCTSTKAGFAALAATAGYTCTDPA